MARHKIFLWLLIPLVAATHATAVSQPFAGVMPLAMGQLAALRGGVLLPNGLDIAIGIDIQTRVDGQLALRTVLSTEAPEPYGLRVLVAGNNPTAMGQGVQVNVAPRPAAAQLVLDRRGVGASIRSEPATAGTTVNLVSAPRETWPTYPGETELKVQPGGAPVATALGDVSSTRSAQGTVVTLRSDSLLIQQVLGANTGVLVANTANDRSIDTMTVVDVDLKGSWPAIANGLFQVNAIALDAASRR